MTTPPEKNLPTFEYETSPLRDITPPNTSPLQGYPTERRVYQPKPTRKMDRFVGTLMTILGVLVIFLLIILLLTSISPNSPTQLVPTDSSVPALDDPDSPGNQGILGD